MTLSVSSGLNINAIRKVLFLLCNLDSKLSFKKILEVYSLFLIVFRVSLEKTYGIY